jgi:ABC-type glucose/galactose transport system permease subunit
MWFARGMCFFISDDAIAIHNRIYHILGQTKILIPGLSNPVTKEGDFISILVVVMLAALAVAIYIAHLTRFGRTVYAIGGNEQSARLMGLPVNRTKVLVYTLNGFCSALAGITYSIYVSSGHGLYAQSLELDVIASVVMGGTLLTGGVGYVFGTLFGVLINFITQTLIQFDGRLSSWWIRIVIGALMLVFIGVQSLLAAQKTRRSAGRKLASREREAAAPVLPATRRNRQMVFAAGGAIGVIALALLAINLMPRSGGGSVTGSSSPQSAACQFKPFRQDQAASLMAGGAIIVYERNGGPTCLDELYAIYPGGRIVGDDGTKTIEAQVTTADVGKLLSGIADRGWFTDEMYDTWHTPCGQCYGYHLTVYYKGQEKTVKAVDGGTDAPADYWQVVSLINGVIPQFTSAP